MHEFDLYHDHMIEIFFLIVLPFYQIFLKHTAYRSTKFGKDFSHIKIWAPIHFQLNRDIIVQLMVIDYLQKHACINTFSYI